MKLSELAFIVLLLAVGSGCGKRIDASLPPDTDTTMVLTYATGFSVAHRGNIKIVEVKQPYPGSNTSLQYVLIPRDEPIPEAYKNSRIVRIPVRSIACTSTTHIPILDYLGVNVTLKGFPTLDFISSPETRKLIDAGAVIDIGVDNHLNIEKVIALKPDLVLGYSMTGDFGQFKKIQELNIPVVINAEYLEEHPLGRAEWLKFVATFYNKEHEADSIFRSIESSYIEATRKADSVTARPTVLTGIMYGDAWFLPGGENYAARIIRDAGCEYPWGQDKSNGFLQLNFETVFEKAGQAELWLGVGAVGSLAELKAADNKYSLFRAFKEQSVYNYDKRKGPRGGNEYLELGYLRPDLILRDIIKIAHPALLPEHELFFYRRLE